MSQIYFDHAATTSMVAPAIKALAENAAQLGNASSLHSAGRNVRKNLEQAREEIAAIADCLPSEIIFTASGTEANNLAIKGLYWRARNSGKKIIITSAFEHHAVMDPIHWLVEHEDAQLIEVDVDEAGVIDVKQFAEIVSKNRDQIALISIMHSNNEIGTLQPIEELVAIADGIAFHSDCVQSFLKTKFSFKDSGLTAATISAHKVGGPLGVAALILQRGLDLEPIKEHINLVKDDLREQYFRGEIFNEGDIVESSDVVYKIIKRGSNHLLLQNEEGLKVSKWIQDVQLTEREFMLNEKLLQEADSTGATGQSNTSMKKAQADSQKAQLAAKQADEKVALAQKQEREREALKTEGVESPVVNKNSKYNIAKSVMSLKDFRKSLGQTKDDKNEEEKEIENKVKDGFAGNVHMGDNHTTRRLRINYHLGEEKLDELSSELLDRYKDKAKKSADDLASKGQYKKSADRWSNIMKATGKQIEKTTANIKNALNKEEVELEEGHDDYREIAKELIKRHGKNVKKEHIKDLENERDSRSPLDHDEVMHYVNKEEFEEISLKEFGDWTEEDFKNFPYPSMVTPFFKEMTDKFNTIYDNYNLLNT